MWLLGFSTNNRRSLWIIGAILLVILLTVILKKWAVYLESQATKCSKREGDHGKQHRGIRSSKSSLCGPGVIRTYALEELRTATREFKIQIGVGGTSLVYLADLGDGRFGAVKRLMEERGGSKKMFLDEISVLLRISHPNLVGLLGFCLERGEQLLLLEYIPNKSLFEKMHTYHGQLSGILTWLNRLSIALDIARALDYLHSQADPPIIHRDVKSSNILLIDNDHAKLADFGLCKLGHDTSHRSQTPTTVKGSFGYVDTCYLNTGLLSPKSDVYSFGVLLLELITGLKSIQGSETLAGWTEECRKNDDIEVLVTLLDPKLNGNVNLVQLRVLINVANSALLHNSEGRPDMSNIVHTISSYMEPQFLLDLPV